MEIERKVFSAEVKGFNDEELWVDHFISTEMIDRGRDRMRADGMRVNGRVVVLMAHGMSQMATEPIAKPLALWKAENKGALGVMARTKFYDGSHLTPPDNTGRRLYEKAKTGFMPNWSIGFLRIKQRVAEEGGVEFNDVLEWELLEYSPVGVPMNPEAQCLEKCGNCQKKAWFKVMPPKGAITEGAITEELKCYRTAEGKEIVDGSEGTDVTDVREKVCCDLCGMELLLSEDHPVEHLLGEKICEGLEGLRGKKFCGKCLDALDAEEKKAGELVAWRKTVNDPWEEKPYPNEHACRLNSPDKYIRIRRQNNKFGEGIHALWGVQSGNKPVELQAIRFSKEKFTPAEAKAWLKDHDYKCSLFEAASEKCAKCGDEMAYKQRIEDPESGVYVCENCQLPDDAKAKRTQCKCDNEKCGFLANWAKNCDGLKCLKCNSGKLRMVKPKKEILVVGPSIPEEVLIVRTGVRSEVTVERKTVERWNKSLSEVHDFEIEERPPAAWTYEIYKKFLNCEIKNIFINSYSIPSPLLGTYLSGVKEVTGKFKLLDTRNFVGDGYEAPILREMIQLNSTKKEDFIVGGMQFYKGESSFVLKFSADWYGVSMSVITNQKDELFNKGLMDEVHAWVKENNFLKGERFALTGEFLSKTEDDWDSLILDDESKIVIRSAVNQMNKKREAMKSRGFLLVGNPGTGKTKSGRVIMNDCGTTFIWVSAKDFRHGSPISTLSLAFSLARDLAPTVLFMEDIDTWIERYSVDLLKTEMDGLKQNQGIITILTSNTPEHFPDALLDRPGRFHHVLDFKVPDAKQRLHMIKLWLEEDVDEKVISDIVSKTEGFSGAHMRELIDFARVIAEESECGMPMGEAIQESLSRLMKQKRLIDQIRGFKAYTLPEIKAEDIEIKGVIGYKKTPLAKEDEAWDGKAAKEAEPAVLKIICAWFDSDKPDVKSSYALPHHNPTGEHACVWNGVRAAAAVLMGARGGVKIPPADVPGVKAHIAGHYKDFDKGEPPWKSKECAEFEKLCVMLVEKKFGGKEFEWHRYFYAKEFIPEYAEFFEPEPGESDKDRMIKMIKELIALLITMAQTIKDEHAAQLKAVEVLEISVADLKKKLEDEPGSKVSEIAPNNPPEQKAKTVSVQTEEDRKAQQAEFLRQVVSQVNEVISRVVPTVVKEEVDRLKGRVK